jgi:hypothetical protein
MSLLHNPQSEAMTAPSFQNQPEQKVEKQNKSADYYLYRHIPHEQVQLGEPTSDLPDGHVEQVEVPQIKDKEPILTPAPVPEATNQLELFNSATEKISVQNPPLTESQAQPNITPEVPEIPQHSVIRTYYIPAGTGNYTQTQVSSYQNTSPPESFFHENKAQPVKIYSLQSNQIQEQSQLRGSYIPTIRKSYVGEPQSNDLITLKFQIINEINRMDAEIRSLAIEFRRQEIMDQTYFQNSPISIEEKVGHLNHLLQIRTTLNQQETNLDALNGIDEKEKWALKDRIKDFHAKVDQQINQRNISFAQNIIPHGNQSRIIEQAISPNNNEFKPRISHEDSKVNEIVMRASSRSINNEKRDKVVYKSNDFNQSARFIENSNVIYESQPQPVYITKIMQSHEVPNKFTQSPQIIISQPSPSINKLYQSLQPQVFSNNNLYLSMPGIKESFNETYDSRLTHSTAPLQHFSQTSVQFDSRKYVNQESERKVANQVNSTKIIDNSNKTVELSNLNAQQTQLSSHELIEGYEFYDEPAQPSSTHQLQVTD